jgi:prepilin peptidase CpaA
VATAASSSAKQRGAIGIDALGVVQNVLLVAFVVTIIVTDWRWRRIPNVLTYPTMLIGLALAAAQGLPGQVLQGGLLDHVAGLVVAFLVSYPIVAMGGMKAGDGKFLMAVGALKGTNFLFVAAVYGAVIGGIIAIIFIVARRVEARRAGADSGFRQVLKTWIPYGVALGSGALAALVVEVSRIS